MGRFEGDKIHWIQEVRVSARFPACCHLVGLRALHLREGTTTAVTITIAITFIITIAITR